MGIEREMEKQMSNTPKDLAAHLKRLQAENAKALQKTLAAHAAKPK